MASALDMPDELLVEILEQAADGQSPWSILQFALVSMAFARIAVPLLYRHIVLEYGFGCEPMLLSPSIKTLLYDTAKIAYVQTLVTKTEINYMERKQPNPRAISLEALIELKRDQIQGMIDETFDGDAEADVEKRMRWQLECLDKRSTIHLFALLFPRMSRLNTFDIAELSEESWRILAESVESQTKHAKRTAQTLPLKALETVGLGHLNQAVRNNPTPITIVLGWPGVKHVTARRVADYVGSIEKGVEVPVPTTESISPSLNTIRLVGSQLPAEYLTALLGSARALETFEYEFGQFYAAPLTLGVSELFTALLQHATSLRTIKLVLCQPDYPVLGDVSPPMDFQCFKSLKKLVIGCSLFLGKGIGIQLTQDLARGHVLKALPSSLEEFSVTKCLTASEADAIVACLETMIDNREEKFPGLEKLHWSCRYYKEAGIVLQKESPRLREHAQLKAIEYTAYIREAHPDREPGTDVPRPYHEIWGGARPWTELAMAERRRRELLRLVRDEYEEGEANTHAES